MSFSTFGCSVLCFLHFFDFYFNHCGSGRPVPLKFPLEIGEELLPLFLNLFLIHQNTYHQTLPLHLVTVELFSPVWCINRQLHEHRVETLICSCRFYLHNEMRSRRWEMSNVVKATQLVNGGVRLIGSRDSWVHLLAMVLTLSHSESWEEVNSVYLVVLHSKCLLPHQARNFTLNGGADLKKLLCYLALGWVCKRRMIPSLTLWPLLDYTQWQWMACESYFFWVLPYRDLFLGQNLAPGCILSLRTEVKGPKPAESLSLALVLHVWRKTQGRTTCAGGTKIVIISRDFPILKCWQGQMILKDGAF